MNEIPVVRAQERDIAQIARRRFADSAARDLYAHLAATAPNGVWVARDEGTVVGIALPHELDSQWYLSDLFVEPSFRGHGVGRRLFEAATSEAADVDRAVLVDASEIGAIAFLARRRMPLRTPVLRLTGRIPSEEHLASLAAGEYRFATEPIDPVRHRYALESLDLQVRGAARYADHCYFAANSTGSAFSINGEFVGYVYVWPDGSIGPMASYSASYLVAFFAFALVALVRTYDASWCSLRVPCVNARIAHAAGEAGLRIASVRLFGSDADSADMSRCVGYHEFLF